MDLSHSYVPSYCSLDDILASNTNVSCKFLEDNKHLGFLDASGEHADIKANSKLELPLWLAQVLNRPTYGQVVSITLPKLYRQSHRKMLQAGAEVVNLHTWGPHYYESGRHLMRLRHPDSADLGRALYETLLSRMRSIMDASMNLTEDDTSDFTASLDELERGLFSAGQLSRRRLQRWMRRQTAQLTTDAHVHNYRKRKAASLDV